MSASGSSTSGTFERHTGEVYAWAYRLLGRHDDALDVVQDVFLRWDAQCAREQPGSARGWLRRVTVNRAIDVRRRRRPEATITGDGSPAAAVLNPALPALDRELLRSDIALAMDGLSDAQRGVLVAKVYDDMTFAQIAAETGLALSTVKTHYLRAVRAVRDRLTPRWAKENG